MKVLVLGHKNHGKTTIAELLQRIYGLRYTDSSVFACERVIWPVLSRGFGYNSMQECHADRDRHRKIWHDQIRLYNTPDPTRLTREILAEHDTYCGLRNDVEFAYTFHLYDLILWVDASEKKPLEPHTSMKIKYDSAIMVKLDNNGPLSETVEQMINIPLLRDYTRA